MLNVLLLSCYVVDWLLLLFVVDQGKQTGARQHYDTCIVTNMVDQTTTTTTIMTTTLCNNTTLYYCDCTYVKQRPTHY